MDQNPNEVMSQTQAAIRRAEAPFEAMDKLEEIAQGKDLDCAHQILMGYDGLNAMSEICHGFAKASGWWHDPKTGEPKDRNNGEMIALMHSELSEGLEALRKDLNDDHLPHRKGIECELADTLIRIFDFAGARGLDLAGAVMEKLAYNQQRADHKLENRANGGKAF